eukprot:152406-Prymnesium_polylepis.1
MPIIGESPNNEPGTGAAGKAAHMDAKLGGHLGEWSGVTGITDRQAWLCLAEQDAEPSWLRIGVDGHVCAGRLGSKLRTRAGDGLAADSSR